MAVNRQELGHCQAGGGLARGQQIERLQALALLGVLLSSEAVLQRFCAFRNRRECFVPPPDLLNYG